MLCKIDGYGNKDVINIDIDATEDYVRELAALSIRLGNLEFTESGFEKSSGNSYEEMQLIYDEVVSFSLEFKGLIDDLIVYINNAIDTFEGVDQARKDGAQCIQED